MRLKSFIAPNVPEAMKLVRQQLGPDAVILSTQNDRASGQVKITAALEDDPIEGLAADEDAAAPSAWDDLQGALDFHRLPSKLSDRILARTEGHQPADALMALAAALDEIFVFATPPNEKARRPIMLIGPHGAGKTATAAKLCARLPDSTAPRGHLITMDGGKAGGLAQITAFAAALEVRIDEAQDGTALPALIGGGRIGLTIIDTPGCNPLDTATGRALAEAARGVNAEILLVLSAGGDALEAADWARAYAAWGATGLIATKLDTTRRLGSVLSTAAAGRLALTAAGIGPHIGGGLGPINPVSLARLLLSGREDSASMPLPLATGTL